MYMKLQPETWSKTTTNPLFLQEKLEIWLYNVRANLEKEIKKKPNFNLNSCEYPRSYTQSSECM